MLACNVSVPDYGELILNWYKKHPEDRKEEKVSVPDYGELILNPSFVTLVQSCSRKQKSV